MAIKTVEMDRRDSACYRKLLKRGGFLSASYLSVSGLDVARLKKLAQQGKLDAVRCAIGKSIRWYYRDCAAKYNRKRTLWNRQGDVSVLYFFYVNPQERKPEGRRAIGMGP